VITFCGRGGNAAKRSITTFRGGGGIRLPEITIRFTPIGLGRSGGTSRITKGFGVSPRGAT